MRAICGERRGRSSGCGRCRSRPGRRPSSRPGPAAGCRRPVWADSLRPRTSIEAGTTGASLAVIRSSLGSSVRTDTPMANSPQCSFPAPRSLGVLPMPIGGHFAKSSRSTASQIACHAAIWHSWMRAVTFDGVRRHRSHRPAIVPPPWPVKPTVRAPRSFAATMPPRRSAICRWC